MKKFHELIERYSEKLELYVPVVARVHGGSHPEFHKVHEVYNRISKKIKEEDLDLTHEFKELREITENYKKPTDTCESYEAVYDMLSEWDKAYNDEVI